MESTHTAHSLDHIAVIDAQYSRSVLAYSPASHHDARKLGNTGVTLAMASLPDSFSPSASSSSSGAGVNHDAFKEPTVIRTRRQVISHLPVSLANGHTLALVLTLNAPFTLRRSTHGGSRTHPATVEYRDISLPSVVGLIRALAARLALLVDPSLVPHRDPPRDGEDKVTVVPHVQETIEQFLVPSIPRGIELDSFAVLGDSPVVPSFPMAATILNPPDSTVAVLKDALVFHTHSPFGLALSNHSSLTLKSHPHAMWMLAMFARLQTIADSCSNRTTSTSSSNPFMAAGGSGSTRSRSRSPTHTSASHPSSHSIASPSQPASTASNHDDSPPSTNRVDSSSRSIHSINSTTSGIISDHGIGPPSVGLFAWFGNLGRRASAALSHPSASATAGNSSAASRDRAQSPPPSTSPPVATLPAPTQVTLRLPESPKIKGSSITATWISSHSSAALFLQPIDCAAPPPDPFTVRDHLNMLFPSMLTSPLLKTATASAPDSPASSRTANSTATQPMQTAPPGTLISPFTSGTHLPNLSAPTASSTAGIASPIIDRVVSVVDSACDASDCHVTVGYALASTGGGGPSCAGGVGRVTASGSGRGGAVRRVWVAKESALGRGVVVVPGHFEAQQSGGSKARDKDAASGAKRDNVSLAAVVDVLLQLG